MIHSMSERKGAAGVRMLIGGFLIHLTLGTLYCFGNLTTYITSYLKARSHLEKDIQYSEMIWIPLTATAGQGLFMTLSGQLEDLIGHRATILMGCLIMTGGVFLSYFTIQMTLFSPLLGLILSYGCFFGIGTALAYAPLLSLAMKWYPNHKGLANGFIVAGFGLGAFIFNQVQTAFLNPMNLKVNSKGYFIQDKVLDRVPSVFLLLGIIYGVLQGLSLLLVSLPQPQEVYFCHTVSEDDEQPLFTEEQAIHEHFSLQQQQLHLSPTVVIRTQEFWILWTTFLLNAQAIGYINSMYKAFGACTINDDYFLSIIGSIAAIFNSIGRIFWGKIGDTLGYRNCMLGATLLMTFLYATMHFVIGIGAKDTTVHRCLFACWIFLIFFTFSSNFVLLPTVTAFCFGTRCSSKNYGLVMTGQAVAAPILALITQFLNPLTGWKGMFFIIASISFVAVMLTWLFPRKTSPEIILRRCSSWEFFNN